MENINSQTAPATSPAQTLRTVLKGATGLLALGVGATFLSVGAPFAVLMGAGALYTGGRQVYETARELLPLKAQSFISELFTGKKLTEITPVKEPATPLAKAVRLLEYVNLAAVGALGWFAGAFAIGMGAQGQGVAALALGGMSLAAGGVVGTLKHAVSCVKELFRKGDAPVIGAPQAPNAPEAAPSSALTSKASAPSFNQSATPDASAESTPALETPKAQPPKPQV